VTNRRPNDVELLLDVPLWLHPPYGTQCLANPFSRRHPTLPRGLLNVRELLVIEHDLQSFAHAMSIIDSL
jgi:hypothetical protein